MIPKRNNGAHLQWVLSRRTNPSGKGHHFKPALTLQQNPVISIESAEATAEAGEREIPRE